MVTAAGDCAVAMFMMLSGYVLAMAYSRPGRVLPSVSGFMARRLINLYPLYFASIIISLLIDGLHPHTDMWYAVLADVLMIQSWIPDVKVYFACNAPVWFVSDLMLCYMLFLPVLKRVVGSRRSVLSNYIYIVIAYFTVVLAVPRHRIQDIIYIQPLMQFPVFMLGMLLYEFTGRKVSGAVGCPDLRIFLSFSLMAVCLYVYRFVPGRLGLSSFWWIPVAVLIVQVVRADSVCCISSSIMRSRMLVMLGDISFSFYIIHMPWIFVWRRLLGHAGITVPLWLSYILCLLTLIMLSIAVRDYFEKPVARWLENRFSRQVS